MCPRGHEVQLPLAIPEATGRSQAFLAQVHCLRDPVPEHEERAEVVTGSGGGVMLVVLQRDLQRVPNEPDALLVVSPGIHDQRFGVQGLRERLGQDQSLRDVQRPLDPFGGPLLVPGKPQEAPDLRCQHGHFGIGLVARQDLERLLHPLDGLADVAAVPLDLAQPGVDTGRVVVPTRRLEQSDGLLKPLDGFVGSPRRPMHLACPLQKGCLVQWIVGEAGRPVEGNGGI